MSAWPDLTFVVAGYVALAALIGGVTWRVRLWLRTPAPRRIPVTPAPFTRGGVFRRMLVETLLFPTLWRASRWTWLFAWCFHLGLVLVALQHLRYLSAGWWPWVTWLSAHGHVASALMLFGLAGLWARRLWVDRVRWISRPSDHAALALLVAIAGSGVVLKYLHPVNVVAVKEFVRGMLAFAPLPVPSHAVFLLHLGLALLLVAVFPFGKLMHGVGLWVNPTRARPDDARARRPV